MTTPGAADDRFAAIVSRSEEELNLDEAALLIAAAEYPTLDVAAYLGRIDELAAGVRRITRTREPHQMAQAMAEYLFGDLGFTGNQDDYSDPRNSFLNEVLDRRLADSEWLARDYSIADIANWCWVRLYFWSGVELDDLAGLKRWKDEMDARPACRRGIEVPEPLELPTDPEGVERVSRTSRAILQR